MTSYWVVGATFARENRIDMAPVFIRRGYWYLGWSNEDAPEQAALRDRVKAGDRIAIKKLMGKGARSIRITTLGIVTEVDPEEECIYVRWIVTDLDREVSIADAGPLSRGLLQSIAGPFDANAPWTRIVFQV